MDKVTESILCFTCGVVGVTCFVVIIFLIEIIRLLGG